MPAEAAAQMTTRATGRCGTAGARASPMPSADKMTMPASNIAASISRRGPQVLLGQDELAPGFEADVTCSPAPSSASSQVANAMTPGPGTRLDPA